MTQALELINNAKYILVVSHINPDPDTISSALALSCFLSSAKIKHCVYNKDVKSFSPLKFLDRFSKISTQLPKFYDLIISVDCGDIKRYGFEPIQGVDIINIDHHISNDNYGIVNIVEPNRASTSEIVYDFFIDNNINISQNMAEALYVGIYSDTQAFSTSRVNKKTFDIISSLVDKGANPSRIADLFLRNDSLAKYRALPRVLDTLTLHKEGKVATIYVTKEDLDETGALLQECEIALNMVLNIGVVDIAMFFRVLNNKTRVSIRSKSTDISSIAQYFGGGGHIYAAGCSIDTIDIDTAISMILKEIDERT